MPERRFRADAGLSLADAVVGPARAATVLAAFPSAIYVAAAADRVLAVEAADGVGLPNALTLPVPAVGLVLDRLPMDARASVGGGAVRVGDLTVTVDHWVDRRLFADGGDAGLLHERLTQLDQLVADLGAPLPPRLAAGVSRLTAALDAGSDAGVDAATGLLGLGDGLTPSGDDVCCGVLGAGRTLARSLGADAFDRRLHAMGGSLAAAARERTTALSASLLWHAARGEMARPARQVVRGLFGTTPLEPAVRALLRVGHSSGRDLAIGLAIGARAAIAGLAAQPPAIEIDAPVEGASA